MGRRRSLLLAPLALLLAACGGPILANPVPPEKPIDRPSPAPSRAPDPQPVVIPRDDGPHDRLTEWWYFTGHLAAEDGRTFGFEDVIFRAERGTFPVTLASHLALTDETGGRFLYDQRAEIGWDHRNHVQHHPFGTVFTVADRFDNLQPIDDVFPLLLGVGLDQIIAQLLRELDQIQVHQ